MDVDYVYCTPNPEVAYMVQAELAITPAEVEHEIEVTDRVSRA